MRYALLTLTLLFAGGAFAEQSVTAGDYVVHYNALATGLLTPEVARQYQISRSKSRAMLNISVLRISEDNPTGIAVEAEMDASATNLAGQRRAISMRLIKEQEAKYYIGEVRVANQETLNFKVNVKIADLDAPIEVSFRQQFYVD